MFVCCEFFVLSGRGLCDELITRPEESYRLWCVVVCDLETSWMRRPWHTGGCRAKNKQTNKLLFCKEASTQGLSSSQNGSRSFRKIFEILEVKMTQSGNGRYLTS